MNDRRNASETTRSGIPMYRKIATELWQEVQSGTLIAGEKLPNEAVLSERFGVTRLTLRQAIVELQRLGAVEIRRGVGTFVVTPPDLVEIVASVPRRAQSADVTVEALGEHSQQRSARPVRQVDEQVISVGPATGTSGDLAAEHLGVDVTDLCHLETVMMYGGQGWIANSYWFRRDVGPIDKLLGTHSSVVTVFTDALGIELRYLWRAFSAVAAGFEDAQHLNVPVGAALLVRDGVSATDDGTPVYYVRRRLRGDEARFVLRYDTD